ncbi:hypothetical protein [Amazonocrinis nigriterrae]|uniref:hypothetical protein n=1 Tax=Amazonocrinis nigriterrae TaxID=2840443 RepID=UPI001BE42157|nr:hypothetical protein [Amazonocrinis nigriterrae]
MNYYFSENILAAGDTQKILKKRTADTQRTPRIRFLERFCRSAIAAISASSSIY